MKPTEPQTEVGKAIRKLREAISETQQQLAFRLGTAIRTIARWERDQPPHGKTLAVLARLANESGRPDLALVFDRALNVELGGTEGRGGADELIGHAAALLRRFRPGGLAKVVKLCITEVDKARGAAKDDPVAFNDLETVLVILRKQAEGAAVAEVGRRAKELAEREGIPYLKAYEQVLAGSKLYDQYLAEGQRAMRKTQFDVSKEKGRR